MSGRLEYTPEQEREVRKYIGEMKQHCSERSETGDWRGSTIFWAEINKERTEEEIFNNQMAEQIFYDACNELGCYGSQEITDALRRGEVPVDAVKVALEYDVLGGGNGSAVIEGYKDKLNLAELTEEKAITCVDGNLRYTKKQRKEAKEYIDGMMEEHSGDSPSGDWRDSGIFWAIENKDKTYDEIFDNETVRRVFFDACGKLGCHGGPEIVAALKAGLIPVHVIGAVLEYDVGLGCPDYPAIAEGYRGRLNPKAEKILMKEVGECKELTKQIGFLKEVGYIQHELQKKGVNPETANMPVSQKIENVLRARGISVEEAWDRFDQVGEI